MTSNCRSFAADNRRPFGPDNCRPFGADNRRGFATENWTAVLRLSAPQARLFSGAKRRHFSAA